MLAAGVAFDRVAPALMVVGLTALLTTLEHRLRSEHLFLANLGVPLAAVAATAGLTAAGLELAAAALLGPS